ncbi:MAG: hypothetical protein ACJ741_01430, partial [Pyrinomonadaceae bacterium]
MKRRMNIAACCLCLAFAFATARAQTPGGAATIDAGAVAVASGVARWKAKAGGSVYSTPLVADG